MRIAAWGGKVGHSYIACDGKKDRSNVKGGVGSVRGRNEGREGQRNRGK